MAKLIPEVTADFSFGAVDGAAPTAMPKNAVSDLINARVQPDGSLRRRWGSIRTHPSFLTAGTGWGGAYFRDASAVDWMVVVFGTDVWASDDNGATWANIATVTHEDYCSFATMRVGASNFLFMANGDTVIYQWDGATWGTVTNAPSGVKFIAVFNSRLYATGHNGVIVQGSAIGDQTLWASPDGLTVQVMTNSGNRPTGLFQIGPHLLVYDEDSTSYIDGYGQATLVVAVGAEGFSRSVGCIAFRTVVGIGDNAACWLSKRGVEYYTPASGIVLITKNVPIFLQSINWTFIAANPGVPCATYDTVEQNYFLALSTTGIRNNRVLVINMLQQVQWQRPGPRSASSVDRFPGTADDILLSGASDGYLDAGTSGVDAVSDAAGYLSLASASGGGDSIASVAGYLSTVTNDALPATLFVAPGTARPSMVYSLGYDGFVRLHYGVNNDDTLSDGTGGVPVEMTVVSRPYLLGRPRQRKRARAIHVAATSTAPAVLTVLSHAGLKRSPERTINIPGTIDDDPQRSTAPTYLVADEPHVEVRTTDDVKLTLIGLTSELMREPTQ
jgi:hypothetical protein